MLVRLLDRLNFTEWRGNLDGRPTFWAKRLLQAWGCRISLHRMVAADDPGCFHTHPAWAVRIVIAGGYVEEFLTGRQRSCRAGLVGIVRPSLCHRIDRLMNGRVSYSLWIRGPKCARINLRGPGWPSSLARS